MQVKNDSITIHVLGRNNDWYYIKYTYMQVRYGIIKIYVHVHECNIAYNEACLSVLFCNKFSSDIFSFDFSCKC